MSMHKFMKTAAVSAVIAITMLLGIVNNSDAVPTVTLDAISVWVEETRYIPVYVDGELVGYIPVTVWVWKPDEQEEN